MTEPQTNWELIHQARKEHLLKAENLGIGPEGKQELETDITGEPGKEHRNEKEGGGSEENGSRAFWRSGFCLQNLVLQITCKGC